MFRESFGVYLNVVSRKGKRHDIGKSDKTLAARRTPKVGMRDEINTGRTLKNLA